MICTSFFITHPLLGQPANLHLWSLSLSQALCRRPLFFQPDEFAGAFAPFLGLWSHILCWATCAWPSLGLFRGGGHRANCSADGYEMSSPHEKLWQEKLFLQGSCQRDFCSPSCCGKGEVLDLSRLCLSVAAITGVVYLVSRWLTLPFWPAGSCLEQCCPDV